MKPDAKAHAEVRKVVGEILDRDDPAGLRRDAETVRQGLWPKLRAAAARIPFAVDAVAAAEAAWDPETPLRAKAMLFAALAYFIAPIDALPDVLPALGFTDDAAVIALVIGVLGAVVKPRHRAAARRAFGLPEQP